MTPFCDTPLKQAALLKSRQLVISSSYYSTTPFYHHSPCLFLWHCSLPWNFFSMLSWYTRCPEPFFCLSAFSQTKAAWFPHAHYHIKSSPQGSLGLVVLIWIDILDHLLVLPMIVVFQALWYDKDTIISIFSHPFQTVSPLLRDYQEKVSRYKPATRERRVCRIKILSIIPID